MGDKDLTEKTLEAYDDVFADIVNVLLFDGKRLVCEKDLSPETAVSIYKADNKLHQQERDVAKYWKTGLIRLALFGMENQTNTDADMPLRVISYDGASYRNQLNANAANADDGQPKERYPVVTLVLYFGYKHHWSKHLNLLSCFDTPDELKPFVNDYRINLFEIAWLSDKQVKMFKSDFRIVANFFKQKRIDKDFVPTKQTWHHVREILELLVAATGDDRYIQAYNEEKERPKNMEAWLTEKINGGISQGENRLGQLIDKLLGCGRNLDAREASTNPTRRMELYREYGISLA